MSDGPRAFETHGPRRLEYGSAALDALRCDSLFHTGASTREMGRDLRVPGTAAGLLNRETSDPPRQLTR